MPQPDHGWLSTVSITVPARQLTLRSVSAPYHFMRAPDEKQEEWKTRDNIIARITTTKEAVASDAPGSNPFGLANGLTYYIHEVEEYDPQTVKQTRRSLSAHGPETGASQVSGGSIARPARQMSAPSATALGLSPDKARKDGYFPPMDLIAPEPASSPSPTSPTPEEPGPSASASAEPGPPSPPPPSAADPKLSPVSEVPPPLARPLPSSVAPRRVPSSSQQQAALAGHHRNSSRTSLSSSPLPHAPVFTPSSGAGRPASVASNHSLAKGLPTMPTAEAAPPMVTTLSGDRMEHPFQRQVLRTPPFGQPTALPGTTRRPSHSSPLANDARTAAGGGTRSPDGNGTSGPTPSSTAGKLVRGFAGRMRRTSASEAVKDDPAKKQAEEGQGASAALDALRRF